MARRGQNVRSVGCVVVALVVTVFIGACNTTVPETVPSSVPRDASPNSVVLAFLDAHDVEASKRLLSPELVSMHNGATSWGYMLARQSDDDSWVIVRQRMGQCTKFTDSSFRRSVIEMLVEGIVPIVYDGWEHASVFFAAYGMPRRTRDHDKGSWAFRLHSVPRRSV